MFLREKHTRHLSDVRAYYEAELAALTEQLAHRDASSSHRDAALAVTGLSERYTTCLLVGWDIWSSNRTCILAGIVTSKSPGHIFIFDILVVHIQKGKFGPHEIVMLDEIFKALQLMQLNSAFQAIAETKWNGCSRKLEI